MSKTQLRRSFARAARSQVKTGTPFAIAAAGEHAATSPAYLDTETSALRARLTRVPTRTEIPVICDERLVVEFYAR